MSEFAPGTVVLAKLKGYPAWPGMVIDENVLSDDVLKARPKTNAKKAVENRWPIRFFNDANYMWASKSEIKELTPEEANKFVSGKGRKDKTLVQAYRIAADPPAMEELIAVPEYEEPPVAEEPAEDVKPSKAKAAKASTKAAKPKKEVAKRKAVEPAAEDSKPASKQSKTESKTAPKKPKSEKPKSKKSRVGSSVPSASELTKNSEMRSRLLLYIRQRLQKGLLSKEPPKEEDMESLSDYLNKLEEIPDLELSIIRQTKVNKVLKAILKIPADDIPLETKYKFHERSIKLLTDWSQLSDSSPRPPLHNIQNGETKLEATKELASQEVDSKQDEVKDENSDIKGEIAESNQKDDDRESEAIGGEMPSEPASETKVENLTDE